MRAATETAKNSEEEMGNSNFLKGTHKNALLGVTH